MSGRRRDGGHAHATTRAGSCRTRAGHARPTPGGPNCSTAARRARTACRLARSAIWQGAGVARSRARLQRRAKLSIIQDGEGCARSSWQPASSTPARAAAESPDRQLRSMSAAVRDLDAPWGAHQLIQSTVSQGYLAEAAGGASTPRRGACAEPLSVTFVAPCARGVSICGESAVEPHVCQHLAQMGVALPALRATA